jgi:hypothetical protein
VADEQGVDQEPGTRTSAPAFMHMRRSTIAELVHVVAGVGTAFEVAHAHRVGDQQSTTSVPKNSTVPSVPPRDSTTSPRSAG